MVIYPEHPLLHPGFKNGIFPHVSSTEHWILLPEKNTEHTAPQAAPDL